MKDSQESITHELADDAKLLSQALGGPRGMLESGAPAVVFISSYAITDKNLTRSLIAAVAAGLILALLRLFRRQQLTQVFAGFIGLGFSAWLAESSGKAENFFLPGILTNLLYATICLVSLLINKPVLGYLIESIRGSAQNWLANGALVKRYRALTYLWFSVFAIRVAIMAPLYLANQISLLGFFKLALGWPLFALAGYLTFAMSKKSVTP